MPQSSPSLRPVGRPNGGVTTDVEKPRIAVNTRENDPKSDVSLKAQVATKTSEPNRRHCEAGPSQPAIEDLSPLETGEDELDSESPVRTDLTGFLERLIEDAKRMGIYEFMNGYGDDVTQSTTDNPVKSKDEHQLSHPVDLADNAPGDVKCSTDEATAKLSHSDNFTENPPSNANDSTDEATQSSPRDPPSKGTPASKASLPQPEVPNSIYDLCSLMSKTTLQASNQKSAMRITIPKAYTPRMSHEHFDELARYEAVAGTKRKRDNVGFKPHEVIQKGALYSAGLNAKSTLTGPIHPVLSEQHWTDCPDHIYEIIKPSLLLVSKFFSTLQCLQHFQTVLRGKRDFCFETSARMNTACYRIKEDVPLTAESALDLKRLIESMAGSITFQFLDATKSTLPDHFFATARVVPCRHSSCSISSAPHSRSRQSTTVSIHTDFYVQAQKLCRLQYPDPSQVMRFHFFVSNMLMHEFAHAFEIACSPEQASKGMEVYMYDWVAAESGRAWERSMFGGEMQSINGRVDATHGLCVMEWPEPGLKDPARKGHGEVWSVPMSFINSLFQESFWVDIQVKKVGEKDLFLVPRTGAASHGLVTFSTAKFEDVLEHRELGDMELALREIEEGLCPSIDGEDSEAEEGQKRVKRRKTYIPREWVKAIGRTGGVSKN